MLNHSITTSSIQNCEEDPSVLFFSVISEESDTLALSVLLPETRITIRDDSSEEECSKPVKSVLIF